jgi:hypothetical protein
VGAHEGRAGVKGREAVALLRHLESHPEDIPEGRFDNGATGRTGARCVLDGQTGLGITHTPKPGDTDFRGRVRHWGTWFPWSPWQVRHLLPHDHHCECGKQFPDWKGLIQHVRKSQTGVHFPLVTE